MNEDFKKAIQYVRENKTWSDAEEQVALERIGEWRCTLGDAYPSIENDIYELMEEYSIDNGLEERWWEEYGTAEDIFFMLDDNDDLPSNFSEMEHEVLNHSVEYKNSTAFQKAMNYLASNNYKLYAELIQLEYKEAFC